MTLYFAFKPPSEPLSDPVEEMGWPEASVSLYDTDLENPYSVTDSHEKVCKAIRALPNPPHTYDMVNSWVRIEYESLVEDRTVIRENK